MAKEDILLREEMGRLEIESVKLNRSRSNENPFASQGKRRLLNRIAVQDSSCSCISLKKSTKNGIIKNKHSKILKEPVLQILKTCMTQSSVKSEECRLHSNTSNLQTVNVDTLNLCTLVKNCNQLKISSDSNKQMKIKEENDKTKWWKNDVMSSKESKDQRHSNPTGSCSQQALNPPCDITIDELASYFETLVHIPKKMSSMAEMMYI